MKKIFILLFISMFSLFTIFSFNTSADWFSDTYGTHMIFKSTRFNNFFELQDYWWNNNNDTYVFLFEPVQESSLELIRMWDDSARYFIEIYDINTRVIYLYLSDYNQIPSQLLGWAEDDGMIFLVIKTSDIDDWPSVEEAINDISQSLNINTWVVSDSSQYDDGYNAGYQIGFDYGLSLGFDLGYTDGYDIGHDDGYDIGYDDGYDVGYTEGLQASDFEAYDKGFVDGYKDGYNKSFIATIDKWLVPAIVIVMFVGGFFAIARTKRDGDI